MRKLVSALSGYRGIKMGCEMPDNKIDTALMVSKAIRGLGATSISRALNHIADNKIKLTGTELLACNKLSSVLSQDKPQSPLGLKITVSSLTAAIARDKGTCNMLLVAPVGTELIYPKDKDGDERRLVGTYNIATVFEIMKMSTALFNSITSRG